MNEDDRDCARRKAEQAQDDAVWESSKASAEKPLSDSGPITALKAKRERLALIEEMAREMAIHNMNAQLSDCFFRARAYYDFLIKWREIQNDNE